MGSALPVRLPVFWPLYVRPGGGHLQCIPRVDRTLGAVPAVVFTSRDALYIVGLIVDSPGNLKCCGEGRSYLQCSYPHNHKLRGNV